MNVVKVIFLTMCLLLLSGFAMSESDPETLPSSPGDLFVIFPNDRYGCIDRQGKIVIPARYDFIGDCKEGLIPVKEKGKWGVIDMMGRSVIPPTFQFINGPFSMGLACAMDNYRFGFIDKKGWWVIDPVFDTAFAFNELGIAQVEMNGRIGFINTRGRHRGQVLHYYFEKP